MPANYPKSIYWLLTIKYDDWIPPELLPDGVAYIRGQQERGGDTGYHHWQLLAVFTKQVRLPAVKRVFGQSAHAEPSRSSAADEYVWKEETRVAGTQFELGRKPVRRNSAKDWEAIRDAAKSGRLDDVPADVFIQHYRSLRTIGADYSEPVGTVRRVVVYWGKNYWQTMTETFVFSFVYCLPAL